MASIDVQQELAAVSRLLELPSTFRQDSNHLIHTLYVQQDFDECLSLIESILEESNGLCEYAVYTKALIFRHQGRIDESLQLFHVATFLNPHSVRNIKQVGRSLYLLGKHRNAIEVFEEAYSLGIDDWEIWYLKGLCHMHIKNFEKAISCFDQSILHQPQDCSYTQLGRCYTLSGQYKAAMKVYQEALAHSPDNAKLLTTLGLLCLRMGALPKAFDFLGTALTIDPRDPKAILAAGSMIQDNADNDVALTKYRLAVKKIPTSAQLWNNIGMCFFGRSDYLACIACLKKALYHGPFEWIIPFNLGLVYINTGQYASAFHYLSASLNFKADFPLGFMYLGLVLGKLNDLDNSRACYVRSLELKESWLTRLNYCATLANFSLIDEAKAEYVEFEELFKEVSEEERGEDPEVIPLRNKLKMLLF
ncbi:hypothetical protein GEMRC1_001966 [Eukaryota sp. GEM-RC1]